ncbi:hypothetical protein ACPCHT_32155 [Nucisporomicrobium flavum]|uniref:hypothetical protein n=1 Tax=Nucisporomicrobium flavum TaxID=2785915 RepID=UPI003C2B5054
MHDSVYDLAGDDPRMAKLLRASLTKLADGPDGPLREMAQGVLAGDVDLRQAAMSDAYGDELGAAFGQFWTRWEQLDDEERAQLVVRTEHQLDDLLDGPAPTAHP